jgi:hypothetical protein
MTIDEPAPHRKANIRMPIGSGSHRSIQCAPTSTIASGTSAMNPAMKKAEAPSTRPR